MNERPIDYLSAESLFEEALYKLKPKLSKQEIDEFVHFFSRAFHKTELELIKEIEELLSRLE